MNKELQPTEKLFAEIGKKLIAQIRRGASQKELESLVDKFDTMIAEQGSVYKRNDVVYILEIEPLSRGIIKCNVTNIRVDQVGKVWYYLFEEGGRRLGEYREDLIFASVEACAMYYRNLCDEYLNRKK